MPFKQPDAELSAWAGQAGWADPATNNTCRLCRFWSEPGERVARTRWRTPGNRHELAARPCALARRMNHEITAAPHDAQVCRHFERNHEPPAVWAPHQPRKG